MKKTIISILILGGFVSGLTNCSDLKFGDGFLEKAPGGDVTVDTIFSSKLYADRPSIRPMPRCAAGSRCTIPA